MIGTALPNLAVNHRHWLTATTYNADDDPVAVATAAYRGGDIERDHNRLCVRRSAWLSDDELRDSYPLVAGFIERHHLQVIEQFTEDDEYMMGGAVVTIYGLPVAA